jgi:flagellar biogenesis protein FliO
MLKTVSAVFASVALVCMATPGFGNAAKPAQPEPSVSTNAADTNAGFLDEQYRRDNGQANNRSVNPPNALFSALKILLYTAIFGVVTFFVVRYVIKKSGVPFTESDDTVEVVLTKSIGMGAYVVIVKIGSEYFNLGVAGNGVTSLGKLENKETIDHIELNKEKLKPKQSRFVDIMTYLPEFKKGGKLDFMKRQKDKLKNM